jgi:hypothetical protein
MTVVTVATCTSVTYAQAPEPVSYDFHHAKVRTYQLCYISIISPHLLKNINLQFTTLYDSCTINKCSHEAQLETDVANISPQEVLN